MFSGIHSLEMVRSLVDRWLRDEEGMGNRVAWKPIEEDPRTNGEWAECVAELVKKLRPDKSLASGSPILVIPFVTNPESADPPSSSSVIEQLEKSAPKFDKDNGEWVKNTTAAKIEGVETRTLAQYRTAERAISGKSIGKDKDGRVWRRTGTPSSHPWYLKSSLKSESKP